MLLYLTQYFDSKAIKIQAKQYEDMKDMERFTCKKNFFLNKRFNKKAWAV